MESVFIYLLFSNYLIVYSIYYSRIRLVFELFFETIYCIYFQL